MEMSWPYPFRSKYNPDNNYTDIDYSMTSPLLADGSNFPCKGELHGMAWAFLEVLIYFLRTSETYTDLAHR
jgi:hypothetical protein